MDTRTLGLFKPLSFLSVLLFVFCILDCTTAWPQPNPAGAGGLLEVRQLLDSEPGTLKSANSSADSGATLPLHYWQLAKHKEDIEKFRLKYNLTIVSSEAKEAALMPGWPQAFVQYIFVAPPISFSSTTTEIVNGQVVYQSRSPGVIILMFASPVLFVAWTVSFGLTQASKIGAGWISVLGWSAWFSLVFEGFGPFAIPTLLFQWAASLTIIIQRWRGTIGTVAYQIVDLHGCTPHDGLSYLERGARSHTYKIFQSVSFSCAVLFAALSSGDSGSFNKALAMVALAELILDCVVATHGTPIVVSGNCLLVELSPRLGFLDSSISTPWKSLTSFMGF
jgi:hypothetical protein